MLKALCLLAGCLLEAAQSLPVAPSKPWPATGATGLNLTVTLAWAASDTATSYDVYFGDSSKPPLIATIASKSRFAVGPLNSGAKYYWKVVAKNAAGANASPTWSFTTLATSQIPCDLNSDGVVNAVDVQLAINQVLGTAPCGSADVNRDGRCDAVDVQRVINASLGQACRIGP